MSGIDFLDVDPAGMEWLGRQALPVTRTHHTRRGGRHLIFRHAEGLRCSASRVAPGVDVKADGGYCIDWSREGFAVENGEALADWPDWLLAAALVIPSKKDHPHSLPMWVAKGAVAKVADADGHTANRIDTKPIEEVGYGPSYSGSGLASGSGLGPGGWSPSVTLPGVNVERRIDGIRRLLEGKPKGKRNDGLFYAAAVYREIIEEGKLTPKRAIGLLMTGALINGSVRDKGRDQCMATILSGFAMVESKLRRIADGQ
jgi:hypothetical protein